MTNKQYSILIVEDDEIDIMNIERSLMKIKTSMPFAVARDGIEALEILTSDKLVPPVLIILDINMPRMNGIEFLQQLRTLEKWKITPVVVLTSSKDEKDRINSYNLNVAGYIVKPIAFDQFTEAISLIESYWRLCEFPKG